MTERAQAVGSDVPAAAVAAGVKYLEIYLDDLEPSPTNPRKTFSKESLEELAESIESAGIIEPLLVRTSAQSLVREAGTGGYEIIAGERRYRAAKLAGLKTAPCIVQEFSDRKVLEIQIIENLQRDDLSPIEEGAGYRILIEKSGLDAAQIGEKVGKSRRYIYGRMKLCSLIPEVVEKLQAGQISASHGDLIGRLSPYEQKELVLERCRYHMPSVKDLAEVIQREYYRNLDAASFPTSDANLLPAAGACMVCPKNSAVNSDLATGKKGAICTDAACFKSKLAAHARRVEADLGGKVLRLSTSYGHPQKGEIFLTKPGWMACKPKECESATIGIVVAGDEKLGEKLTVCADKKCKKHWAAYSSAGNDAYRKREAAERKKCEVEEVARKQLWLQLWKAPRLPANDEVSMVGEYVIRRLGNDAQRAFCQSLRIEAKKGQHGARDYQEALIERFRETPAADRTRFLLQAVAATDLVVSSYSIALNGDAALAELAKRSKLDVATFRKQAQASKSPKTKPAVPKPKAKKVKPASKAKIGGAPSRSFLRRKMKSLWEGSRRGDLR